MKRLNFPVVGSSLGLLLVNATGVEGAESEGRVSRRQLLRPAWDTSMAIVVAELVGVALAFLWPRRKVSASSGEMSVGSVEQLLSQLPVVAVPKRFRQGRFYLSHVEDGLLALFQKCTHLGCVVPTPLNGGFPRPAGVV